MIKKCYNRAKVYCNILQHFCFSKLIHIYQMNHIYINEYISNEKLDFHQFYKLYFINYIFRNIVRTYINIMTIIFIE